MTQGKAGGMQLLIITTGTMTQPFKIKTNHLIGKAHPKRMRAHAMQLHQNPKGSGIDLQVLKGV